MQHRATGQSGEEAIHETVGGAHLSLSPDLPRIIEAGNVIAAKSLPGGIRHRCDGGGAGRTAFFDLGLEQRILVTAKIGHERTFRVKNAPPAGAGHLLLGVERLSVSSIPAVKHGRLFARAGGPTPLAIP